MSKSNPQTAIDLANTAEAAGAFDRALNIYKRAIVKHPDNPELHYLRGRCLFQLKRYPEALTDLTRTLDLQPTFVSAYMFRALVRYVTGDHSGAIADNTEALKSPDVEPEFRARILYARAMSYRALSETELAQQDFESAKVYDPTGEIAPYKWTS